MTTIATPNASSIEVTPDVELRFDRISDIERYRVIPLGPNAASPNILSAVPTYDLLQSGNAIFALAPEDALIGIPTGRGSLADGVTNIIDPWFDGSFNNLNIGDWLEIKNGSAPGRYRIIDVQQSVAPSARARLYLDGMLPLLDVHNGYVSAVAEVLSVAGPVITYRVEHPAVTPSDGLVEVMRVYNQRNGDSLSYSTILAFSVCFMQTYNTFTSNISDAFFSAIPGDRVLLHCRVSPKLQWEHTSGTKSVMLNVRKLTLGQSYRLEAGLVTNDAGRTPFPIDESFTVATPMGQEQRPRVLSATFDETAGMVLVVFNQEMRTDDANLLNPDDYVITGPTTVSIKSVHSLDTTTVALTTLGLGVGSYTLTVSTSTPKDIAGNPVDPSFNSVVFTSAVPEMVRSIFTDKGPIAKPPLTLQSGVNAVLQTYNEVTLPGATLNPTFIGRYVRLTGGAMNGGSFRISSVLTATRVRLANASFTLPDPDSGTLTWSVYDPRHGQIADDPADVTVRVNNTPVTPTAVVGLLGQIVLPTTPDSDDDVKVDYSWVLNPTVEVRRLNSREFRLNSWNRDVGYAHDATQHKYRYNNVLVRPEDYDPDDPSAVLAQPLLRELHYRAYERAYTPVLNDPSLLLLNSPIHRIAYPPAERIVTEQFVAYEGIGLPEALVTNPWVRRGTGTATSSAGRLTVTDNTSGAYPSGKPIFWTRPIDLTFPHVYALSWRFSITSSTPDGVWTGVAAGYSDDKVALVVGYVLDGGTRKIGILKRGFGDNPASLGAWTGGVDGSNNATGAPAEVDWGVLHSYRVYRDRDGVIRVYLDGDVVEVLRVTPDELPFLEELSGPFDEVQGAFFGSLSRPAQNVSSWDFIRYLIQPTNPRQAAASSFVSYEANVVPEQDAKPWTPVGFHGTETILNTDFLLLDSTSATDAATASDVGLVGGDYKGFVRFEPLLTEVSEFVVDAQVQPLTFTNGISPYGCTLAVDDGQRLMQVALFTSLTGSGKGYIARISYGGRSFPENFTPFTWQSAGTASAFMQGRILRISDSSTTDGKVYYHDDPVPFGSVDRTVGAGNYILEVRCRVVSFTVDGAGYAGVFFQGYDSARAVGALFEVVSGTKYVTLQSDGVTLGSPARFAFNWGDGEFHTYRLVKNTTGDLVSLFIDGVFVGSLAYSSFVAPPADPIGQFSFGSSTPASSGSLSVVDWAYANAWAVRNTTDYTRFIGIWKGSDPNSLLGYHLPLKTSGRNATVVGNALGDPTGNFLALGVTSGDYLLVDVGTNRGVYQVGSVGSATALTITGLWVSSPSQVDYRIVKSTDWSTMRKYRLARASTGEVDLFLDTDTDPLIRIGYNALDLPPSGAGIIRTLANGLPTIAFGSFDAENLAQTKWDFVRYGLTQSTTELRLAPHHQVLNQWNVMESPERLFTALPHTLTDFKSSSTGNVPKVDPDFLADSGLAAFTQLNQGTPLVPRTQTFEVRAPYPVQEFTSALNRPEDVLNNDGDFTTNDGTMRFRLIVPKDVLYTSLDVIEQTTGDNDLIAPFDDECQPNLGGFQYTKEVCLTYDGSVLPESDTSAPTPWELVSDNPAQVTASTSAGVLTYGTGGSGTKTVYRNNTPLPDHPSLINEIKFRLRLLNDSTGGTGPSQVMFGFSAPGMTAALTFVTTPLGERFVLVVDLNTNQVLGSATFDYLDGNYHTYRIIRDPGHAIVQVFIDS